MPENKSKAATPRWGTKKQAAEHIGVSERTVRNYIAAGRITGYRLGDRAIRIDLNELDALMRPVPTVGTIRGGGGR